MRSALRSATVALLAVAAAPQPAIAAALALLPAQSEIVFVSRQIGVPVQGRFKRFEAEADFDPARPEAARVALHIALASVAIGTAEIEAELAKPGWFDSRRFPTASFVASDVRRVGPERYEVAGRLTLKGQSRDLVVPIALAQPDAKTTVASGSFTLRRSDFRIGDGEWSDPSLVADEVEVRFRLTLVAP